MLKITTYKLFTYKLFLLLYLLFLSPKTNPLSKLMIYKITTKLLAFVLLVNATLFAQMAYYTLPPQKITPQTAGFTPVALYAGAPTTDAYNVTNGAYSPTGQLLFFIKNNAVYNGAGVAVGNLGIAGNLAACTELYTQILGEVAIVPIPGSCTEYYAIYTLANVGVGSVRLVYTKINCTAGAVTVTNASGPTVYSCGGTVSTANFAFTIGFANSIAVSKIVSGTGTTALRYLYAAGTDGITKYDITSAGFTNAYNFGTIGTLTANDYGTMELELAPDQKWLAFSNYYANTGGTKVFVLNIDPLTGQLGTIPYQSYTLNKIKGLEFDKTLPKPLLYVAGGITGANVLAKINTATQVVTNIAPGAGNDFSNTFLELAKNGWLMAVTPGTAGVNRLSKFNTAVATPVISSQNIGANPRHTFLPYMGNVYTLADQIDGEDYTGFSGNQYVALNAITLNNLSLTGDCEFGGILNFYNCNAMLLNATYLNSITTGASYKIDVVASVACAAVTGTGLLNYQGAWVNGAIPTNYDLRTLTDANGNTLLTATGQHSVSVTVKDACGNITTKSGFINVLSTVPAVLNLEIYNTYYTNPSVTYVPASTNVSAPVLAGALSAGFRINGSTGAVTGYNVTIDEVSSTGIFIKNIYNKTTVTNNITTVGAINLNSLCVPTTVWGTATGGACTGGYTGYWGANNAANSLNKYYKIAVTLNNPCSNVTAFSYVLVNNAFAKINNPNGEFALQSSTKTNVLVYPNPSSTSVNFNLSNEVDDVYTIEVFDVVGKKTATLTQNTALTKGNNTLEFNVSALPNGVYIYKINSATLNKTGLLHIIN